MPRRSSSEYPNDADVLLFCYPIKPRHVVRTRWGKFVIRRKKYALFVREKKPSFPFLRMIKRGRNRKEEIDLFGPHNGQFGLHIRYVYNRLIFSSAVEMKKDRAEENKKKQGDEQREDKIVNDAESAERQEYATQ